jgi:cysteine peptidase B
MRAVSVLSLALLLASMAAATAVTPRNGEMHERFLRFKRTFNRSYTDDAEDERRFAIFTTNMKRADELQARNPHAKFAENVFADLSSAEFKTRHNAEAYYKREVQRAAAKNKFETVENKVRSGTPSAYDWRDYGAVTYVKNQGQCGSCWSFSTTGNIEGQWAIAGHGLVALSEQELVSCDSTNNACNGGIMDNAFEWLLATQNGVIVSETTFPYVSANGAIPACPASAPGAAQIGTYLNIAPNEATMAAWLAAYGPVSIGVDATSWQSYSGGVLTDCVATQMDHGVLLVGYDVSVSPPYWIIKNSWGPQWGEAGYIRIQYGVNECLVATTPCSSRV